jgi:hypothetical protein
MKMIWYLFFFATITCNAQETKDSEAIFGCTKNEAISAKMNFENDLKTNKITIYLQGGIVSVIKKEDLDFQKKYGIYYKDFGCLAPINISYYEKYNYQVFNYLSTKFAGNWKEALNINAYGANNWIKS